MKNISLYFDFYYLRQRRGYVFTDVCLSAGLLKTLIMNRFLWNFLEQWSVAQEAID